MEKKYRVLIVLVVILSVLLLALGGYVIYDKVLKDDKPIVDNNVDDAKNEETKYEFLLKEYKDYTFVDHTVQDVFKLGHTVSYDYSDRIEIRQNIFFGKDSKSKTAYIEVEGKKVYIDVVNVDKVYAYPAGCSADHYAAYILDEAGNVYTSGYSMDFENPNNMSDSFEKIDSSIKYERLGRVQFDMFSTCGVIASQIGVDSAGNEYYVATGEKFDVDYAYYFGFNNDVAVKTNGDVYTKEVEDEDYTKFDVRVKKVIADNDKEFLFVDSNGYLGFIGYEDNIFAGYKKISDKKVNSVFVKLVEDKTYLHVVYEDSAVQDFEY